MRVAARIDNESVNRYSIVVEEMIAFDNEFSSATCIFEDLETSLSNDICKMEQKAESLGEAHASTQRRIEGLKARIAKLESKLSYLQGMLAEKEFELSCTNPYYYYYDKNGNEHCKPNRVYRAIERKIAYYSEKIGETIEELDDANAKLEYLCDLLNRIQEESSNISNKIDEYYSYRQKVISNHERFESVRSSVSLKSNKAMNVLKMIKRVIADYLSVKPVVDQDIMLERQRIHNSFPQSTGNTKHRDDNRVGYRDDDSLRPNSTIEKNGYTFMTDNQGRVRSASGRLYLLEEKEDRNWDANISVIGKGFERVTDDRGHLIGHRFGGPDSLMNAVPQDMNINRGIYKQFEDELAERLKENKTVIVTICPYYSGGSFRPEGITVIYSVDGERRMKQFPNERKEK
ncbi:MAG: DNA/RNA non-specific endonuclease [Clostridiales bacterium]|nr:DNA/RNA non-specific endonuclease [Clostridiales bacterium]